MKSIATELKEYDWIADFISVYPSRFSKTIHHPQQTSWNGLKVRFLSVSRKYPNLMVARLLQMFLGHLMMLFFVLFQSSKYEVLYFYNPRFTDSLMGMRLASLLRKTIVVDQTELFSLAKNSKIHKIEEQWVAKHSTALLTISKKLYNHFRVGKNVKKYHLPIMVDIERFNIERAEEKHLLGYIGSFASKDGIQTILNALVELKNEISTIRLRLIGYHPNLDDLLAEVERLDLTNNVEVTGTVTYSEIPWLLCECDTLIMNRNDSKFAAYGYPIKLGEYFACKRTVLMSNGDGFSEDFEDGNQVYKYTVNDSHSLAEVIKSRYYNSGEADAVSKRGFDYAVDYFDSKKLGNYLVNILNEI